MKKSWIKFKSLVFRNIKLYFSDKMVFLMSLMAPLILLLLFILFLNSVFESSLTNSIPEGFVFVNSNIPKAFVSGWVVSAIMSVAAVTVSIGTGTIMVQDKITGAINDFKSSPVKNETISVAYYIATFISALTIVFTVLILGFIYIAIIGWYLTINDVLLIILNTFILTLLGSSTATIISTFIKTEGAVTAVFALSSSVYGFICGAYMPLSQFGPTFSNIFGFNPGLYSSILYKNLFTKGAIGKMSLLPEETLLGIKDGFDLNFYFFGAKVPIDVMWIIVGSTIVILSILIILITKKRKTMK